MRILLFLLEYILIVSFIVISTKDGLSWQFFVGIVVYLAAFLLFKLKLSKKMPPFLSFGEESLLVCYEGAVPIKIIWSNINRIEIVTSNQGPSSEDLWWVFSIEGAKEPIFVPNSSKNISQLFGVLETKFKNVAFESITEAMGSTENCKFDIWERKP